MSRPIPLPALVLSLTCLTAVCPAVAKGQTGDTHPIPLPQPRVDGPMSVEAALYQRRSIRRFRAEPVRLAHLGQILWAAQGVTEHIAQPPPGFSYEWRGGMRTAPSAGALYPLELYALVGDVEGLEPGLYRFQPVEHALARITSPDAPPEGARVDLREEISDAALRQLAIRQAPVVLVLAGAVERTTAKYGDRGERYVHIEVGAAAQNVYLECESLELGTVYIGAFDDAAVATVLGLPGAEQVFGIMPIGYPAAK